jgi:sterol desaturase/sphingolipid hydroxylase (fatty acid hydroxylase superfamily)
MHARHEYSQSPRMFESAFLDFFSRCHPIVVPVLYVPGAVVALAESLSRARVGVGRTTCVFALGLVLWTLAEYWLHRLVFHWQASSAWGKRLHFFAHGVHHQWPRDKYRLVMPPGVSIPLYFGFLVLFLLVLGRFGWAFHGGFVTGYAFYDLTHFWLHHGVPRTAYGRRLRRHHMLHHFKDSAARFGVSSSVWDRVFGSMGGSRPAGARSSLDTPELPP